MTASFFSGEGPRAARKKKLPAPVTQAKRLKTLPIF